MYAILTGALFSSGTDAYDGVYWYQYYPPVYFSLCFFLSTGSYRRNLFYQKEEMENPRKKYFTWAWRHNQYKENGDGRRNPGVDRAGSRVVYR